MNEKVRNRYCYSHCDVYFQITIDAAYLCAAVIPNTLIEQARPVLPFNKKKRLPTLIPEGIKFQKKKNHKIKQKSQNVFEILWLLLNL